MVVLIILANPRKTLPTPTIFSCFFGHSTRHHNRSLNILTVRYVDFPDFYILCPLVSADWEGGLSK